MPDNRARYVISAWLYVGRSMDEGLTKIAHAGFSSVELWADTVHLDPRRKPDRTAARRLLQDLGLQAHSIHTPVNGLSIRRSDPELKQQWLETVGASLELSAYLDCRLAVVHCQSHHDLPNDPAAIEASKPVMMDNIHALQRRAQQLGVRLALENLPRGDGPYPSDSLAELSSFFPDPDIGFCLDIGHAAVNGRDCGAEIKAAGKRLLSLHVSNNDGLSDQHWMPERGVLDWQRIKKHLAGIHYPAEYVLEVRGGDDPDSVLAQLQDFVRVDSQL